MACPVWIAFGQEAALQRHFYFQLNISREQFLRYYQGSSQAVQVVSECGRRIRFPAARLRPFLTQKGIQGRYCLTVSRDNRMIRMERLRQ